MMSESRGERVASSLAVLVFAAFAVALVDVAYRLSATHDEVAHIAAAASYWDTHEVVLNIEHPPLVKLVSGAGVRGFGVDTSGCLALFHDRERAGRAQWLAGEELLFQDNPTFHMPLEVRGAASVALAARLPVLVFPLGLALVAYLWSRSRQGPWAGLVTLVLVTTYPDLLGHGPLVTTDAPLAATALAAGWALSALARRGGAGPLVAFALLLGAALATKFLALIFLPGFLLALAPALAAPLDPAPASARHPLGTGPFPERARGLALAGTFVLAASALFVTACYLGANPVRLYRAGIAEATWHHPSPHDGFLFGAGGRGSWWFYFPVILALRLPLGSLAALGLAGALGLSAARSRGRGALAEPTLVLAPGLVFLGLITALAPPVGSRYLLAGVPFLFVAAGGLATWAAGSRARSALVALLLGASVASAVSDHPFHGTVLNHLAGPLERQYRVDRNEDLAGGYLALARWQREHEAPSIDVVPFRAEIEPTGTPPRFGLTFHPFLTHFAAYGVVGTLRGADALYAPERGHVYAVSEQVLSWSLEHETDWSRPDSAWGGSAPHAVLGSSVPPTGTVAGGSMLIFDLR
jgi:4-amino-4-deoxy-L-arabinose transferase-like glycosyltransferase